THSCNPYDQLGHLSISPSEPFSNRWIPYRVDCQPPALMASLVREAWAIQPPDAKTLSNRREWEDVSWATNRTVVLIGDSLGRENVGFFCQLLGEQLFEINYQHPWHPSGVVNKLRKRQPSHHSHACYIPSIDFLVIQVFTFGLDVDGYWSGREPLSKPYPYESRMAELARPYVDAARGVEAEPDLVYLASAMWDLAKWREDDGRAGQDAESGLDTERLEWYRTRVRDVLLTAREVFPSSPLAWLTNHYQNKCNKLAWRDDRSRGRQSDEREHQQRPFHRLNRLAQMNQAARSAYEKDHLGAGVDTNMWGEIMIGQEKWQRDDLHHLMFPGGYVWADILLYDLKAAVEERTRWW
ncbi:hypothetical protein BCR39DRAFT_467998, partial [Naematelia encephala]